VQLLIEELQVFLGDGGLGRTNGWTHNGFALGTLAAFALAKDRQRQTASDGVQPRRQSGRTAKASRLTRQGQKGCLEHILGEMFLADQPPSRAQDHWSMPVHQKSECRFIPILSEPPQ
jgi:hypothetical protein